jgi:hypothetical protein
MPQAGGAEASYTAPYDAGNRLMKRMSGASNGRCTTDTMAWSDGIISGVGVSTTD